MDRSINYQTDITLNTTGSPGKNNTKLDLDFKPVMNDEGRRLIYNLTMSENLSMDRVLVRWKVDIYRPILEREMGKDVPQWGWKSRPEYSSFDSGEGNELARMHWEKNARMRTESGESYSPVNSTQIITEEDLVLEVGMDIGSGVQMVESGGYLEFLDPLFEFFGAEGKKVENFLKDHLVSIAVGVTLTAIIIFITVPMVAGMKAPSDPERELDYRKSRFYRRD